MRSTRRRRGRRLLAAFGVAASVAAACSSGDTTSPRADVPADPLASSSSATSTTSTTTASPDSGTAPVRTVEVLRRVAHRTDAFTQGLAWDDGRLYESTGLVGQSTLSVIDPATGAVERTVPMQPSVFGEGLAKVGDRLIVLTWKDQVAFVHDATTLGVVGEFTYSGEGWGLCHDGEHLVMSDGSPELTFRETTTFEPVGSVTVQLDGTPVEELNELECVGDRVYANVWRTDTIVEIDPATGTVTSVIDATPLLELLDPPVTDPGSVLNGIAHDPTSGTFWLTGKRWPQLFEVRFGEADG